MNAATTSRLTAPVDDLRTLLDTFSELVPADHSEAVTRTRAWLHELERGHVLAASKRIVAAYRKIKTAATAELGAAEAEVRDALAAVADPTIVVLRALRLLDEAGGAEREHEMPESLQPPAGLTARQMRRFHDANDLYLRVATSGEKGIAQRELGRDLDESRRAAALNLLKSCDAVVVSRVPNPGQHPPQLVWLRLRGDAGR